MCYFNTLLTPLDQEAKIFHILLPKRFNDLCKLLKKIQLTEKQSLDKYFLIH